MKKKSLPKGRDEDTAKLDLYSACVGFWRSSGRDDAHGNIGANCEAAAEAINSGALVVSPAVRTKWQRVTGKIVYNVKRAAESGNPDALRDGRSNEHRRQTQFFERHPEHQTYFAAVMADKDRARIFIEHPTRMFPFYQAHCNALNIEPAKWKPFLTYHQRFKAERHRDMFVLAHPDKAKGSYKPAFGRMYAAINRAYELWELDFEKANVSMVDGKRWYTCKVIDACTAEAFILVCDIPSAENACRALYLAIEKLGRIPKSVRIDNGAEFIAAHFLGSCQALGIRVFRTHAYSGEEKPRVERFHKAFDEALQVVAPHIGRNVAEAQDIREAAGFANRTKRDKALRQRAWTPEKLQAFADDWLVVYHNTVHRSLGCTPKEMAAKHWRDAPAVPAEQMPLIALHFAKPAGRGMATITRKGIVIGKREYACPELFLPRLKGARVLVREHPRDAGRILVFEDAEHFLGIAINPELAGVDRAELAARCTAHWNAAVSKLREERRRLRKGAPDLEQLALDSLRARASLFGNVEVLSETRPHESPGMPGAAAAEEAMLAEDSKPRDLLQPRASAPVERDFERFELPVFASNDARFELWSEIEKRREEGLPVHAEYLAWHRDYEWLFRKNYESLSSTAETGAQRRASA